MADQVYDWQREGDFPEREPNTYEVVSESVRMFAPQREARTDSE